MVEEGLKSDFKRNFLTGLAALFPLLITIFLLAWAYQQFDKLIGGKVRDVCASYLAKDPGLFRQVFDEAPLEETREFEGRKAYARARLPRFVGVALGVVAAMIVIYLMGKVLRGYIGRKVMNGVDRFFERFPVVKSVYPHARQVGNFLFGQVEQPRFHRVVAVEYPRRGVYSVGFTTGEGLRDVEKASGQTLLTVFIPTSPAPLTGFIIQAPPSDVVEVDMSVEEAFRFCVTAGMLAGGKQRLELSQAPGEAADVPPDPVASGGQRQAPRNEQ